ncbi:MAG: hypothetical protein JNL74_03915 [Fibrobacteres bacterium]|nr:hypothetical protein [Fibrobacterota bacterium]
MSNHLSSFKLEAILCGDLNPEVEPEVKEHLKECAICAGYLKKAPLFSESFETSYSSVDAFLKRQNSSADTKKLTIIDKINNAINSILSPRPAVAFGSIAMVLALVLFLYQPQKNQNRYTIKGNGYFELWVNGNKVSGNSIRVKAGDTLQFGITSTIPLYYAIYYQDDNGPTENYCCNGKEAAAKAGKSECELLPNSIILNSGWKNETIYAYLSNSPLTIDRIKNKDDGIIIQKFLLLLE